MFSPLEQFAIHIIWQTPLAAFLHLNNSVIFILVVWTLGLGLWWLAFMKPTIVPNRWQVLVEGVFSIVADLLKQQAGKEATKLVPLFAPVFLFILLGNLVGLVPYCFTVTGQLLVTGAFAFSIFLGLIILGFAKHHLHFLHLFMPQGISGPLLPFLVVIEVMSYTIRPFSLAIRLFANMLAGHTLLHILANFVFFVSKHNLPILLLPFTFLLAIATLEVGIAFIQAYVFVILSCIYLNDSLNLH